MNLSAINSVNASYQTAFGARVSSAATDKVVQTAKEAKKISELAEVMSKVNKWGLQDTIIDLDPKTNFLFIVYPKNPMNRYIPYGKNIVEQMLGINEKTIQNAEENLICYA